ncbi:MAG: glycosyltransferase [Raineya sp.]|nr:glycosyltransferase [Raineya sp.]
MLLLYILGSISVVLILLDTLAWILLQRDKTKVFFVERPLVSILVAVRNEENSIMACLQALENLTYPKEKLEILLGNDQSTDNTAALIEEFIAQKPYFKLFHIEKTCGNAIGKANVLAQLARKARGEWLFFTDADTCVPNDWVQNMLALGENRDVITGFTWVQGKNLWATLQALDWTFALAVAKIFSDFRLPVTAMGNNMAVRRSAYDQTGGYENLPATLTEDFALLKAITTQKGTFKNLFSASVLAETQASPLFSDLLKQRKRWMRGALQARWYAQAYVGVRVGFYIILVLFAVTKSHFWQEILIFWGAKVLWQSVFLHKCLVILGKKIAWLNYLLFELYAMILSWLLPFYYILPFKIDWKGRLFN